MNKVKKKAICILGMHRSGTSVITRACNLLGAYIGEQNVLLSSMENVNPEGFWEHSSIVDIHEKILSVFSHAWDTIAPLPDKWWEMDKVKEYREELKNLVTEQFGSEELWVWKDPRTCLLIPLWLEILNELQIEVSFVIVVRNPLDVAASLEKRDGFPQGKSILIWSLYNISALKWTNEFNRVIVHYDQFLDHWEWDLKRIADTLHLQWPEDGFQLHEQMNSFVKPELRHNKSDFQVISDKSLPNSIVSIYQLLLNADSKNELKGHYNEEKIKGLFEEVYAYLRLFTGVSQAGERKVKEADNTLNQQALYIDKCHQTIADKDNQLDQNVLYIDKCHQSIADKDNQLDQNVLYIDKCHQSIAEKDKQLTQLNIHLEQCHLNISEQQIRIDTLERIRGIYENTLMYKLKRLVKK
jgi:hypothetical protein